MLLYTNSYHIDLCYNNAWYWAKGSHVLLLLIIKFLQ